MDLIEEAEQSYLSEDVQDCDLSKREGNGVGEGIYSK